MEADWKTFRDMVPRLRERYLAETNKRLSALLSDPGKTETERFWDTLEAMRKGAKTLEVCLNHHSRSNMMLAIELMLRAGILKKEDMSVFSEDLQSRMPRDLL